MTAGSVLSISLPPVERAYDIVVRVGVLGEAGAEIAARLGIKRCVVITDSLVEPLYLDQLKGALEKAGHTVLDSLVVPFGEASKNFDVLHDLLERLLAAGADRKTAVIALGGGVIGDLSGCVAALALRGLDLVQVPTTLLAQVDSSVGGKNGINGKHGKNTIGAFYQPRLVLIDPSTLDTLPQRQVMAGYAEVVKYGLIRDKDFFDWCEASAGRLISGEADARAEAIVKSCGHKAEVVVADEHENGERALLNLGHTFGHALESVLGYDSDALLHGESVAIGTVMAARLSARMGMCSEKDVDRIEAHFMAVGLSAKPPQYPYEIDKLMAWMAQDKKAEAGRLNLVLLRGIGEACVVRDVDADSVQKLWQDLLL